MPHWTIFGKKVKDKYEGYVHPGDKPGSDWGVTRAEWDKNPFEALKKALEMAIKDYKDGAVVINIPQTPAEAAKHEMARPLDQAYSDVSDLCRTICISMGSNQIVFNSVGEDNTVAIFKHEINLMDNPKKTCK